MIKSDFLSIWRGISRSTRGSWNEDDLGRRHSRRFRASDIGTAHDFIRQNELHLLISLVQSCEGFFSTGPTGGIHDLDRIRQVLAIDDELIVGDYRDIPDLLDVVVKDMRHQLARRPFNIQLERRFMKGSPAPKEKENGNLTASRWLIFLNDDYHGGEILWPSRMQAIRPKAGTVVRWPIGIPHARSVTTDGYQFTLSGMWE